MGNTAMHCKSLDNRLFYDTSLFTQFQELIAQHEVIASEVDAARQCSTMPYSQKRPRSTEDQKSSSSLHPTTTTTSSSSPTSNGHNRVPASSSSLASQIIPSSTTTSSFSSIGGIGTEEEVVSLTGPSGAWCGDAVLNKLYEDTKYTRGWLHWWSDNPEIPHENWTIFGLMQQGQYMFENCKQCPKTVALLQKIPNIRVAGFSRLQPRAEIAPHTGFTGRHYGSLAFHLGLVIPKRGAGLKVGSETHRWRRAGEVIIFDDTFVHSAWNHSDSERIILYIDFMIPPHILASLPPPEDEEDEEDEEVEGEEGNAQGLIQPAPIVEI